MKIYDKKKFWSGLGILAIGILFFFSILEISCCLFPVNAANYFCVIFSSYFIRAQHKCCIVKYKIIYFYSIITSDLITHSSSPL